MIAAVLAVVYLTCGGYLYNLFFSEPEIIAMGVEIMRVIVVVVLLQIAQVIYMGCLRGAGDVIYTTIASTVSVTIVRPYRQLPVMLYGRTGNHQYLVWCLRRSAGSVLFSRA